MQASTHNLLSLRLSTMKIEKAWSYNTMKTEYCTLMFTSPVVEGWCAREKVLRQFASAPASPLTNSSASPSGPRSLKPSFQPLPATRVEIVHQFYFSCWKAHLRETGLNLGLLRWRTGFSFKTCQSTAAHLQLFCLPHNILQLSVLGVSWCLCGLYLLLQVLHQSLQFTLLLLQFFDICWHLVLVEKLDSCSASYCTQYREHVEREKVGQQMGGSMCMPVKGSTCQVVLDNQYCRHSADMLRADVDKLKKWSVTDLVRHEDIKAIMYNIGHNAWNNRIKIQLTW